VSAHGLVRVRALLPVLVASLALQGCGHGGTTAQAPSPCTLLASAQATRDLAEPVTCKTSRGTIPYSTVGTYAMSGAAVPPLIVGIYVGPNDSSRSGWQHIRVDAQDAYWTRQPGGHVLYMIAQTPTWFVSVQITEPEATEATAEEAMTTLLRHLTS